MAKFVCDRAASVYALLIFDVATVPIPNTAASD
jgi:hypothetical protein